jgi:hypothetical protein
MEPKYSHREGGEKRSAPLCTVLRRLRPGRHSTLPVPMEEATKKKKNKRYREIFARQVNT